MNTILTDDELIQIAHETESAEPGRDGYILPITYARAIEAAVLAKLREQEPVEYQILILGSRWTHCAKHIYDAAQDRSTVRTLYAAPLPAVVQVPQIERELIEGVLRGAAGFYDMASAPAMANQAREALEVFKRIAATEAPAQMPRGECFTNGNICARCGHPEFIEAPAQGEQAADAAFDEHFYKRLNVYAEKHPDLLVRQLATRLIQARQPSVPAPWREAVKVMREALEAAEAFLLSAGLQSSDAYAETCAALAQLDALEGGE